MLYPGVRYRAPRGAPRGALHRNRYTREHSAIVHTSSSSGHAIMKPASNDERLLVHPLVLAVEPATLQAATLRYATRDASVDRSPPAATLLQLVGGWSGRHCNRGPSARFSALPSQPHHFPLDRHSSRIRVPPFSINASTRPAHGARKNTAPPHEADRRSQWRSPGQGGYWQVLRERAQDLTATPRAPIGTWGETRSRKDTLALATDTLALATDTLAHQTRTQ